jgi:Ser/Thr protein kinase RdoA (MazF antagonist)
MPHDGRVERGLDARDVGALLDAFGLGASGTISDGPVASGRLGSIWRLDTDRGSWAVKQVRDPSDDELTELLEGAAFQEAGGAAGIVTPAVRRTTGGAIIADLGDVRARVHAWVEIDPPRLDLAPEALGRLLAGLHQVPFTGSIGLDAWYAEPVGAQRWAEILAQLRERRAPFADDLNALLPEMLATEALLGGRQSPNRMLRTCHRDLWADNVRRTAAGDLCVFDFDNAGHADPSQELAAVLVEYAGVDTARARAITSAYEDAGGPGRLADPEDFRMPIAQLHHIVEEGCRRWLLAPTDEARRDNEGWVREFLDRPLTRDVIASLLSATPR